MGLREEIRAQSQFVRMRLGQDAPELVEIPSMSQNGPRTRVALVPLTEADMQQGMIAAARLEVDDNVAGINARNRAGIISDVWHACRMPNDVNEKVWESPDEMTGHLQPTDIDWLYDQLTVLMAYASPNFNHLSDADLSELKKGFNEIDWRELTGRQASALVLAMSLLLPELLQDRLFSSSSTLRSTETSESETLISSASPS